jgi:hypothetical protein
MKELFKKENRAYTLALTAATVTDYIALGLATYAMHRSGCSPETIALVTPAVKSLTFLGSNRFYHKILKNAIHGESDLTEELKHITLSNATIIALGAVLKGTSHYALMKAGISPEIALLFTYPLIGYAGLRTKMFFDKRSGVLKGRTQKQNLEKLTENE